MSFSYNGIVLPTINTQIHTYGPVKDPSGTDALFMQVHLTVKSLLTIGTSAAGDVYPPATLNDKYVDQIITRVRHDLCQPRKALYYNVSSAAGSEPVFPNGIAVINITGRDDATGPWPDESAITVTYTTPGTLEINWSGTVFIRDCGSSSPSQPISNRWEQSISYNKNFQQTVRWTGTCIISALSTVNIDQCRRNIIAPLCPLGFRRESSNYTVSKDGLRCDYSFLDSQIRWAPVWPAVDMEIDQSESWEAQKGEVYRKGQCTVTVTGSLTANPASLRDIAMSVCRMRIFAASPLIASGRLVASVEFAMKETTTSTVAAHRAQYLITPTQIRQIAANNNNQANWNGVDRVVGDIGQGLGLVGDLKGPDNPPVVNNQGNNVTTIPALGWVGFGTGGATATNKKAWPGGYAPWAGPREAIVAPADGLPGLAPTVFMFASILQDQCGMTLPVTPNAPTVDPINSQYRTQVSTWNTPTGGNNSGNIAASGKVQG